MDKIGNVYGVCGLMGNLQAESALISTNMQNSYEKKLGMNDESYTKAVDNGTYTNFATDRVGYGLAQWTSSGRKQGLFDFAKANNKSIGDEDLQLDWLIHELQTSYKTVLNTLKNAKTVKEASDIVVTKYERPANQSEANLALRAQKGEALYKKYAKDNKAPKSNPQKEIKASEKVSNSSLVDYTKLSPNHSGKRTHEVDRITPHCFVGQVSVERGCEVFQSTAKNASCNYVIAKDGKVGLVVDEANRSWCSSSESNDQRAITIEVASDTSAPYAFTDKAYNKLIDLSVDICKRYGKKKLIWLSEKEKSLSYSPKSDEMLITVHRWFANKACPGEWLYSRLDDLSSKVTEKLGGKETADSKKQPTENTKDSYLVKVVVSALNIRSGAGMNYPIQGCIRDNGTYTIVEEKSGWGRLKSGVGWISLAYTKKV